MSQYLLAISIGPVQGFIAAARRTKDLWFGSQLLSNLSKGVAFKLKEHGCALIFPQPEALEGDKIANISNVILADIPEGVCNDNDQVKEIIRNAEHSARQLLLEYANDTFYMFQEHIRQDIWEDQVGENKIDDLFEYYAAFVSYENPENYKAAHTKVMRLLAGRKACRDFRQSSLWPGVPKSSLDGARETVWKKAQNPLQLMPDKLVRKLRLKKGEQLDAMGLVKRSSDEPFPSVSRIAADPWLRGLDNSLNLNKDFSELKNICQRLVQYGITKVNWQQFIHFPHEGTVIYRDRYPSMAEELKIPKNEREILSNIVSRLEKAYMQPMPYLAILVADGDRMGSIISSLDAADKQRDLSKAVASFASECKNIVEKRHGCLVYAGGDDVLAFLPVDTCLDCANDLQIRYNEILDNWKDEDSNPSALSVGIAVGHFLEPLEDLLTFAREAEKLSKQETKARQNPHGGLSVSYHPRSGLPITIVDCWDDTRNGDYGAFQRLSKWIELFSQDALSSKAAFDLQKMLSTYQNQSNWTDMAIAIKKEIELIITKKQPGGRKIYDKMYRKDIAPCLERYFALNTSGENTSYKYYKALQRLANEWLIARKFAEARRQSLGLNNKSAKATQELGK